MVLTNRVQVAPPANGKKLWRVKRTPSLGTSTLTSDLSLECWNNSLRISAAGRQLAKRPPTKRPKSKDGVPKSFVFVDLSPVRSSDDDETSLPNTSNTSPLTDSGLLSPLPLGNFSFGSILDDDMSQTQNTDFYNDSFFLADDTKALGLGFLNMDYNYSQPQPMAPYPDMLQSFGSADIATNETQNNNTHQMAFSYPEQASVVLNQPSSVGHKRAKSVSTFTGRKNGDGSVFRSYKGPNAVRKHSRRSQRSVLESNIVFNASSLLDTSSAQVSPVTPSADKLLQDFMHLPEEHKMLASDGEILNPEVMSFGDNESFLNSLDFGFSMGSDFLKENQGFLCFPTL